MTLDEDELKALVLLNQFDKAIEITDIISYEQSEEIQELKTENEELRQCVEDLQDRILELNKTIEEYMANEDD